jgi:hypothetical protein
MLWLHSDSSRSYTPQGGTEKSPGGPVRRGVVSYDSAGHGNMTCDRAGVSRGHSRHGTYHSWRYGGVETSLVNNKSREVSSCRRAELKVWGIVHMCSVTR